MTGPVADLAAFAAALRSRGMTVTPSDLTDMAKAMTLVDPASRSQVHASLRALAVTSPNQHLPFDEEFDRFFGATAPAPSKDSGSNVAAMSAVKPIVQNVPDVTGEDASSQAGASAVENLQNKDFAEMSDSDLAEARRMVMAMTWQPSDVKTRRWSPARNGRSPDLRRTLRNATRPEGALMPMELRRRRLRQRPLIVIADVSGSMERYAELFVVFTHAAMRRIDQVEAFTFSTELTRITDDLKRRDVTTALAGVSRTVTDWSGGTKIGEAIAEWNRLWSRRLARGGPIALILSDGWDTGEPELLRAEMARLARSVHQVIWLNPLAARADYRPATRGMRAALPHIDHLLPAASVRDLRGVVRLLDSLSR